MRQRRVVFFGSDEIGLGVLEALGGMEGVQLVGVVSQPDRPSGRGQQLKANGVSEWAMERGVELRRPEKPGEEERLWMVERGVDLGVVMAYGHILRQGLLDAPRMGMVNLHGSLLPKYRGASPVETAILRGEKETGVSLMRMVLKMDAGAVGDVERVKIGREDTGVSLRVKIGQAAGVVVERSVGRVLDGTIRWVEQDEGGVTYCGKIRKEDGLMDFRKGAEEIERQVRAYVGWPGSFFDYRGERLKVERVEVEEGDKGGAGEVIEVGASGIKVGTGKGVLVLKRLQRPGGRMMEVGEFLRGYKVEVGGVIRGGE